jgi:tetratricopeptide (TPR) repeat protein
MTRSNLFLASGVVLLGAAVVLGAPPPHGHMPARPSGPVARPVAHPNFVPGGRPVITSSNFAGLHTNIAGPPPLLTNPHPTVVRSPLAVNQAARLHQNAFAAASVAHGLNPSAVGLYLASQHHSHYGWGWGGWGWGYPGFGFYGFNPFGYFPWGYGSGFGIGFGYRSGPWAFGVGYGFGYSPAMPYFPYVEPPVVLGDANPPLSPVPDAASGAPPAAPTTNFADRGQELFLEGKYDEAVKSLRHAVVDDPQNGPLLALTGEALWAAGNYNEAAGALQQSLLSTPEADWTGVANRAARLVSGEAVGKLAKALGEKELPEMRFLAAYQSFGAGKYEEAAAHLDLVLKKAPDDQVAKKLREQAVKLGRGK